MRWVGMHFDCGGIIFNEELKYDANNHAFAVFTRPCASSLFGNGYSSAQIVLQVGGGSETRLWIPANSTPYIGCTAFSPADGHWHSAYIPYTPFEWILVVCNINDREITVYSFKNGALDKKSTTESNTLQEVDATMVTLGGPNWVGSRIFFGDILFAAIWKRNLDKNELAELANCSKICSENIPALEDCVFACILDRLKYGDKPYDFVNGIYGKPVDPSRPPRWRLMLTSDVGLEVLG